MGSIPLRASGDRIKTDRRDAVNLAKLHRAGELTAVWVPDQTHEAIRDLVRARLAAVRTLRQARQQLSGFLLRQGRCYHRPAWTLTHRRWLAGLTFEQRVHHIVLEDCSNGPARLPASPYRGGAPGLVSGPSAPGRDHQGRQRGSATHVDRGGVELSVSRPDQP